MCSLCWGSRVSCSHVLGNVVPIFLVLGQRGLSLVGRPPSHPHHITPRSPMRSITLASTSCEPPSGKRSTSKGADKGCSRHQLATSVLYLLRVGRGQRG